MIRTVNIVLMITSMLALTGVYILKYSGNETATTKQDLQHRIERQKGDLSLLEADWAYLNQPGHIAPIIARHPEVFNLQPVEARQFMAIEAIPMRPRHADTGALDDLFKSLASGNDPANAGTGGH